MGRGHEHIDGVGLLLRVLGMAGVDYDETKPAHYWEALFAWPMLLMALWLLLQWFLQDKGIIAPGVANTISWLIWLAFVLETVVLAFFVENKVRYLRTN